MQRFKKFVMARSNTDAFAMPVCMGAPYGYMRGHSGANYLTGRFVYGEHGTLTQAARWQAMAALALQACGHAERTNEGRRACISHAASLRRALANCGVRRLP